MRIMFFSKIQATSHTSRATQSYLEDGTPNFIKKDEWPFQSPDCNPLDCNALDSLLEKVYSGMRTAFKEGDLKDAIRQRRKEISQNEVRKAILSRKNCCKHLRRKRRPHRSPLKLA